MPSEKEATPLFGLSCAIIVIAISLCLSHQAYAGTAFQIEYLVIAREAYQESAAPTTPTEAELLAANLLNNLPESASGHHRLVKNIGRLAGVKNRVNKDPKFRVLVHAELVTASEYRIARYAIGTQASATHSEIWIAFRTSDGPVPRLEVAALYKENVPGSASMGATSIAFDERFRTAGVLARKRISAGKAYFFAHADYDIIVSVGKAQ